MRDTLDRLVTWAVVAYLAYAVVAIGLWLLSQVAAIIPTIAERTR